MVLSEATHIDINRKKHKPDIAMLTVMLTVGPRLDEPTRQQSRGADGDFLSVYHLIGPINRREGHHHSINAWFELHDDI